MAGESLLIEQHVKMLTNSDACASIASVVLRGSPHLIKARSVASGASLCIFKARLVEAFGVSGYFQSIVPGKGSLVHQILAIAFPMYMADNMDSLVRADLPSPKHEVLDAVDAIEGEGVISDSVRDTLPSAIPVCEKILLNTAVAIPALCKRIGLELRDSRIYTEFQMMSYKLHVWGVLDALIEDSRNRKAVILDWKTGKDPSETAVQVGDSDLAQTCTYALLEAERLGYSDPRDPIVNGNIVPVVARARGNTPLTSISPAFRTTKRDLNLGQLLDNIILTAEHLTLTISDVTKHTGVSDRACVVRTAEGRSINALRYSPRQLPKGNPRRGRFPCKICPMTEECLFYFAGYENPEEFERLAWRSRRAIYGVRENALQPYKDISEEPGIGNEESFGLTPPQSMKLGGSNRVDFFEEAQAHNDCVVATRAPTEKEIEEERIISVRAGKPVAVFFSEPEVPDILLRLNFVGRADDVQLDSKGRVAVVVGPTSVPSRLHPLLLEHTLSLHGHLKKNPTILETNVDLTSIELRAIDAFQRGTKQRVQAAEGLSAGQLEQLKDEELALLFGSAQSSTLRDRK
jgi:hypothetical protein